jgi:hypothetical protein
MVTTGSFSKNCFEYETKGNNHWSNYTQSSRNIRLKDGHILEAECRKINGEYVTSIFNLNLILGNDHGSFAPGAYSLDVPILKGIVSRKYDSPQEIQLLDGGKTLSARLFSQDTTPGALFRFDTAYANLDSFMGNDDGRLVCGYIREGRCSVCNSFPVPKQNLLAGYVDARDLTGSSKWIDCPSCKILDELFQSLQGQGFLREDTKIKCIWGDKTDLPQMIFECRRDNEGDIREHFEMYRVIGKSICLPTLCHSQNG